jgi:hypothetical protein
MGICVTCDLAAHWFVPVCIKENLNGGERLQNVTPLRHTKFNSVIYYGMSFSCTFVQEANIPTE